MAGYLLQQDWAEKPPSGTPLRRDGHWSVQGLAGCWALNEVAGGTAFDVVGQAPFSIGTSVWSRGSLLVKDITVRTSAPSFSLPSDKFTFVSKLLCIGAPAGSPISLFSKRGAWNGSDGAGLWSGYGATGDISFSVNSTRATSSLAYLTTANNGRSYVVVGTYDRANVKLYVNGSMVASSALTAAVIDNVSPLSMNGFGTASNGVINETSVVYSRALSPAEIASLSANPWQVFEPRTIWVEVGSDGTDLTFSATSTSISTSLYSPSIVGSATTLVSGATNSTFNLIDPTVSSGSSIAVTPAVLAALFGVIDPSVSGSSLVAPSAQNAVVTQLAPSITGSASILTSVQNAAFAQILASVSGSSLSQVNAVASLLNVLSPLVDLGGNALITPAVLSAVFSTQDPSVYFDNKFAVGVVGSILGSNSPIVIGDASVAPSVIEAIVSAVTPVLRGDSAYSASVVSSVYSAVQPLVNLGVTISVNINGATFAVNPVTFSDGSIVVNVGAQNVSVNILTPVINKIGRVVMVIKGGSPSVTLLGKSGSLTIH